MNLVELNNNKNIKTKCLLSSDNKNNIPCNLNEEINGNYVLEPFLYSDENEIITLVQNDVDDYFNLECETSGNRYSAKKSSSELSSGIIIGIVVGVTVLVIIVILIIICQNRRNENKNNNNSSSIFAFYNSSAIKN